MGRKNHRMLPLERGIWESPMRIEWAPFDLTSRRGLRVEVRQ
jgi:hypothetical protein